MRDLRKARLPQIHVGFVDSPAMRTASPISPSLGQHHTSTKIHLRKHCSAKEESPLLGLPPWAYGSLEVLAHCIQVRNDWQQALFHTGLSFSG